MTVAPTITIPGTRATLPNPPGFELSDSFTGLACPSIGASIMVTEMPAAVGDVRAAFEGEALADQGMTLLENEETTLGDRPALLIHARQLVEGNDTPFEKWMIITGTEALSLLVTAAYPETIAENVSRALESTIRAVEWDPYAEIDKLAGLPYTLEIAEPFDVANRLAQGVLLTPDGDLAESTAPDPFFAVSTAGWDQPVDADAIQRLALQRIEQSSALTNIEILSIDNVEVDGLPGAMIVASAVDTRLQSDVIAFLAMAFAEDRYFLLQGACPPDKADEYVPLFEKMTASLKRVSK